MITLENSRLAVVISPIGAEMHRIVHDGIDRLWEADPAVWGRHAPLLFPLIGRLRGGCYELDGSPVKAPTHGFCRERPFAVEHTSKEAARFSTSHDADTMAVFPFPFKLTVEYRLDEDSIVKTHIVENRGTRPMPFELGGHEAYATCLAPGERISDYRVRFAADSHLEMFDMDENGILGLPKRRLDLDGSCLRETPEQLGIDTIVLDNVPESTITLESVRTGRSVTVDFPDFPYLGIWTAALGAGHEDGARYLCLEPWSALPDAHFSPHELAEKPGVRIVEPGKTATLSYRMTFR